MTHALDGSVGEADGDAAGDAVGADVGTAAIRSISKLYENVSESVWVRNKESGQSRSKE